MNHLQVQSEIELIHNNLFTAVWKVKGTFQLKCFFWQHWKMLGHWRQTIVFVLICHSEVNPDLTP